MIIYLSGIGGFPELHERLIRDFPDIGVLCTYANPKEFYSLVESGFKNIMVDSGAYSVSKRGITINLDNFIEFLKENEKKITVPVGLDVIGNPQKSYDNWKYMLSKGVKNPLPTFHLGEDISWLDAYCQEVDYVGLGGIAGTKTNWTHHIHFLDRIYYQHPNHKFHIFGVNSYKALTRFPICSCDATTWLNGGKFGEVTTENGRFRLRKESHDSEIWKQIEEELGITKEMFLSKNYSYQELNYLNISGLYYLLNKQNLSNTLTLPLF